MSRDITNKLANENLIAIRVTADEWPRGMLSGTPVPDKWHGLIETADRRRRYAPAGDEPRLARGDRLLLIRNRPLTIPVRVDDCEGAGGNTICARCEVLIRWSADENDLAALGGSLLDGNELTLEQLSHRVLRGGATAGLGAFVRANNAADLVRSGVSEELLSALRESMKRFCFETGAKIDRVVSAEFTSDSYLQQQARERETAEHIERIQSREMVEQAALTATNRRLEHLKGVLDKLESAAGDDDNRWHDLLPALSPTERGRLLENLWRLTPDRRVAEAIVAVAGREVLWYDPGSPDTLTRRITLGDELGGLRSVGFANERNALLIGAAQGVWLVDATSGEVRGRYDTPDIEPQRTGYNEAIIHAGVLYATHSGLGCRRWNVDDPQDHAAILNPENGRPRTVRAITAADDGRIFFAADARVYFYDPQTDELVDHTSPGETIFALRLLGETLFVATGGGKLLETRVDEPGRWKTLHRVRNPIESITVRRWNDLTELVVPSNDEGVVGVYGDEGVVVKLLEARVAIRRAWACDDVIVGLSERRDQLLVMNANLPERTALEVPVAREIGHSIQDACLVTRVVSDAPA